MARYDFRSQRLFVEQPLQAGIAVPLDPAQAHYLADVLRLAPDDEVLVFNGRDGEWQATLARASKRVVTQTPRAQARAQSEAGEHH
jgi:16S rRNA (uracil1498-N3)-methyltransferase